MKDYVIRYDHFDMFVPSKSNSVLSYSIAVTEDEANGNPTLNAMCLSSISINLSIGKRNTGIVT